MRKLITALIALAALSGTICESFAFTRYTTYDRFGNRTGTVRSIFPGIVSRYDTNGRKTGTYFTNRNYNRYYSPSSTALFPNRVINRTYYYNNRFTNPAMYRYNGGLGGLKSYNRFGQRIR